MASYQGRKAAKRGFAVQELFICLVNNDRAFNDKLKQIIGIDRGYLKAEKPGSSSEKADVILVSDSPNSIIGCSLKEAEVDFNQLERVWLNDFASSVKMPNKIQSAIQTCLDNRRLRRTRKFIDGSEAEMIKEYFMQNVRDVLWRLFTRNDPRLKFFIVYDYQKKEWFVQQIEDVIAFISSEGVTLSNFGVLKFGKCMSMQRKGGNGHHIKIPKSDPRHPGNQIQFKVKPILIAHSAPAIRL